MILAGQKLEEFKILYPTTKNSILAQKYGVKLSTITSWASKNKVVKEKGWYWEDYETRYLLKYYKLITTAYIAEKLGRTRWSVINKYREEVGLRKNLKTKNQIMNEIIDTKLLIAAKKEIDKSLELIAKLTDENEKLKVIIYRLCKNNSKIDGGKIDEEELKKIKNSKYFINKELQVDTY